MDRNEIKDRWQLLIDAFREILDDTFEGDYEDLFRYAEKLQHYHIEPEEPYRGLERVIHEYLPKVRSEIMASTDDNFLRTLTSAWNHHKTSIDI